MACPCGYPVSLCRFPTCDGEQTMNANDFLPCDTERSDPEADVCSCADCYRSQACPTCGKYRCDESPCPQARTPFSITGPGEYRTRDGRKVIILDIYDERAFGRYQMKVNGDWKSCDWNLRGQRSRFHSNRDIVAKWEEPRKPVEGWVNVYDNRQHSTLVVWKEKQHAINAAFGTGATTVKVRECPGT